MDLLFQITIFPIERFMELCLGGLYSFSGDYGTSIILLSLVINTMLIPVYRLADKWQESEKSIQDRMSEEIDSIKRYYSGKKRYFQLKAVYRRYGYNQLSALKVSLGFLIQIPFFFAAYLLINNDQNLNGTSFLFIKDLGAPDQFLYGLNILPVMMTVVSIASGVIYARNMTNSQKLQLHSLSFIFLIILYNMPSGLVIYWTMSNVISLIKNSAKGIKTLGSSEIKSKFTTANLHNFFNNLLVNQHTRYLLYGMLFIVFCLMTFYYFNENKCCDPLALRSIELSAFLLFASAAIVALGLIKHWTDSIRGGVLAYLVILLTISIVPGLLSINLKASGIIISSFKFIFFYELITIVIFLFCLQRVLLKEHDINILEPFHSLSNYDKKHFTLTLILFHIIFYIWGTSLTLSSATPNEFHISSIYILLWQMLFFLVSFCVLFAIYLVVPQKLKYLLTFSLQYLCVMAIIYLVFNQRVVGLMDHFILASDWNLNMQPHELFLEILLLYFILLCLYLSLRYASGQMNRVMSFLIIIILLGSVYNYGKIFLSPEKERLSFDKYELALAKDKSNILIFMLDAFSGGTIKNLEDKNPELLNDFDGFTWYKNTLTVNTGTAGSIATIYGGHKYSIENINMNSTNILRDDFIEAYNFYNRNFAQHGYKTKIVNPHRITCDEIDNNAECYRFVSFKSTEIKKETPAYTIPLLISAVTTFKAIPHMFQDDLYDHGAWHGLSKKRIRSGDYHLKEWNFLLTLKDSVNVVNEPTFNFFHLHIPHLPNIMDSKCAFVDHDSSNYLNDVYCSMNAIREVIARMKELEVYDNTMIVLIADHGWWIENPLFDEEVFSRKVPAGMEKRLSPGFINPLLMVKDINSRGNLDISEVFLSNADLPSIVCTVIGSCEGIPPDYRKYEGERVLTINLFMPENQLTWLSQMGYGYVNSRYEVTDNIFDASNWKKIY